MFCLYTSLYLCLHVLSIKKEKELDFGTLNYNSLEIFDQQNNLTR